MLLDVRFLNDVSSVNSFDYIDYVEFYGGDTQVIYLQLVNASVDKASAGFSPAGRRYMPAALSNVSVTFRNLDDSKVVTRFATQPFALDPSIWSIPILASDTFSGTVSVNLVLIEGAKVYHVNNIIMRVL